MDCAARSRVDPSGRLFLVVFLLFRVLSGAPLFPSLAADTADILAASDTCQRGEVKGWYGWMPLWIGQALWGGGEVLTTAEPGWKTPQFKTDASVVKNLGIG